MNSVQWGIKRDGFLNFQQLLVSVRKDKTSTITSDPLYSRRVSGAWDGSSPGQVTFTLNSIQTGDERLYICRLGPKSLFEVPVYDSVQLLVGGKKTAIAFLPLHLFPHLFLSLAQCCNLFSIVG